MFCFLTLSKLPVDAVVDEVMIVCVGVLKENLCSLLFRICFEETLVYYCIRLSGQR